MKAAEWEGLLLSATEKVWNRVSPMAKREGRGRTVGIGAAGDRTILADKLAEGILLRELDGVPVLSEEAGRVGPKKGEVIAIVDPLDGSSNFERGIPFYCTSVAIVEGAAIADTSVGVVRDLVTGDVYSARKGAGARKNGSPIHTSTMKDATQAVVGVDLSRSPEGLVPALAPLVRGVKRQVHLGANALEVCYLAEGKIDSFVDLRGRMRITDFAGANLIALEAGAVVSDARGGKLELPFDLQHRFSFVASANAEMHRKVLNYCSGWGGT